MLQKVLELMSQISVVVRIVMNPWTGRSGLITTKVNILFLTSKVQTKTGPSQPRITDGSFAGVKRTKREANHTYPPSAGFENMWSFTSYSHTCFYDVVREKFTCYRIEEEKFNRYLTAGILNVNCEMLS